MSGQSDYARHLAYYHAAIRRGLTPEEAYRQADDQLERYRHALTQQREAARIAHDMTYLGSQDYQRDLED